MEPLTFRKISERRIFADEFLGLREDTLIGPHSTTSLRKVVEYTPASVVLLADSQDRVLLLRHYRHPVGRWLWEVPGGMVTPGEAPETAAAREAHEETGFRVHRLEHLITFFPEPAFADHRIDVFRGTDLEYDSTVALAEAEISRARFFTRDELKRLMDNGEIASSWTLIAIAFGMSRMD
jgi:8-oxo-dGTP pyrophosphatase MutT (NUDIX family)